MGKSIRVTLSYTKAETQEYDIQVGEDASQAAIDNLVSALNGCVQYAHNMSFAERTIMGLNLIGFQAIGGKWSESRARVNLSRVVNSGYDATGGPTEDPAFVTSAQPSDVPQLSHDQKLALENTAKAAEFGECYEPPAYLEPLCQELRQLGLLSQFEPDAPLFELTELGHRTLVANTP